MAKGRYSKLWVVAVLIMLLLVLVAGCGQKGDPAEDGYVATDEMIEVDLNFNDTGQDMDKGLDDKVVAEYQGSDKPTPGPTTPISGQQPPKDTKVVTNSPRDSGHAAKPGTETVEPVQEETVKFSGTILYFYTQTCSACRIQEPILAEWISDNQGNFPGLKLVKVNLSSTENSEMAEKHRVVSIPMFVALNESDSTMARLEGVQEAEQLNKLAETVRAY